MAWNRKRLCFTFENLDSDILSWDINIYLFHVSKYGYIFSNRSMDIFIIVTWKSLSIFHHQIWNPLYVTFEKTYINFPTRTNGLFYFIQHYVLMWSEILHISHKKIWMDVFNVKYRILYLSYLGIDFLKWNTKSWYFTYKKLWIDFLI